MSMTTLTLLLVGLLLASPSCAASLPSTPRLSNDLFPSAPSAGPELTLTVDVSSLATVAYESHAIPGNFMGLSIEWSNPQHLMGPNTSHPHLSFYTLLPYMSTRSGQGPTLRIGGSSSDRSWYYQPGLPPPHWSDFVANITDDTYAVISRAARVMNLTIAAGVSFRYPYTTNITGPEVRAMVRVVGEEEWASGRWAIEVGNEQDIMDACGAHPYEDYRPCGWGWNNFTVEYDWSLDAISKLLPSSLPSKIFQAGGFCCIFTPLMADWAIARASRFASLSFHRYVWNGCGDNPTLDSFLSDYAGLAGLVKPLQGNITLPGVIARIRENTNPPIPIYLGEGNSVGCEGMAGVTDTFAQVVWLMDYTLALSSFNVSGMQFYTGWTNPDTFLAGPFIYPRFDVDEVLVKPMMYGMWAFAFATYNHARILNHTRTAAAPSPQLDLVKSWTLVDADDNLVVVLIRKDRNGTAPLNVSLVVELPEAVYAAHQVLITAPSMTATSGIALAGLTWEGTTNGVPRQVNGGDAEAGFDSTRIQPTEERRADGTLERRWTYAATVPPHSVAIVVIPTSAVGAASWQRRVQTILRVTPPAESVAEPTATPAIFRTPSAEAAAVTHPEVQ